MRVYFGGGLNEQQSHHINEAAVGSINFDLNKDLFKLTPRRPFDLRGTATNAGDIRGLLQLVKRDDTETTLVQAGAAVYKWDGSGPFSSVGACSASSQLRGAYWSLNETLIVTDIQKTTAVSTWDGTTFGTLSTGLGATLYAKYGVVHKGRVWLFNVKTTTDTPHLMVASAFENHQSYDTTNRATSATFSSGNEAFYMLTPDLRPINGVCVWQKELIISTTEGRLYRLTGSSSIDYAFVEFYVASNAIGNETMVNMGNDIIYMRKGGNIETVLATQQYGDVTADDLSRWIPTTVKNLNSAITVYDQTNQKVLFFVNGKVLVFFKDIFYGGAIMDETGQRAKLSPWSVYTTQYTNGFVNNCANYMRIPGTTQYSVFFGDGSGNIFDLNGGGIGDGGTSMSPGNTIKLIRKTRVIDSVDKMSWMSHVCKGSVQYRRIGACSFSIDFDWVDEYNTSTVTLMLKGPALGSGAMYFGGPFYWGGAWYWGGSDYAQKVSHQNFSAVGKAPGVRLTFYSDNNVQYQVDNVDLQ